MDKLFKGINHGTDQIIISTGLITLQGKPIEIHLKEDGALGDKPSLAIVIDVPRDPGVFPDMTIIAQISLKMLNEGLSDIGYKISKI